MKNNNNTGRIIESISTTNGNTERTDEFWSAESLRRRPIEDQYLKLENESDSQYNDRLQEIQSLTEIAQADLSDEDRHEIEKGAYTKKKWRGCYFKIRENQKIRHALPSNF